MKVLVCVDVQNDFITGVLGDPKNVQIAKNIANYAGNVARKQGYQIFATCDTHTPETYPHTIEGKTLPIHCVEGTDGHKIFEGLVKDELRNVIIPQGHIFDKPSFVSYLLISKLNQMNAECEAIDEMEFCGFCTGICVLGNAVAARSLFPNVKVSILTDLCGDLTKEDHDMAVAVMKRHFIEEKKVSLPSPNNN